MQMAEEAEIDLVEKSPHGQPPVCRIMDYGKFKYQEAKKAARSQAQAEAGAGQGSQVPPGYGRNDYQIKLRNMVRFLEEGDKVKVTLRFRDAKWRTRNLACASWNASRPTSRPKARSSRCRRWKAGRW